MADKITAGQLLTEAAALVDGDRDRQHGNRFKNFATIAGYWSVLFELEVPAWKVARALELVKIARDQNGEANVDNGRDGAGYSALAGELRQGEGNAQ